jgi:hypothetical protein
LTKLVRLIPHAATLDPEACLILNLVAEEQCDQQSAALELHDLADELLRRAKVLFFFTAEPNFLAYNPWEAFEIPLRQEGTSFF